LKTASGSYARGARIAGIGIAATALVTQAYLSLASHSLGPEKYGGISLLWSAIFLVCSILYRPVEQLLSRSIADRDARGVRGNEHLRVAATIQLALGVAFIAAALALRGPLQDDLFGGASGLYWVLVIAVPAYAASYFARGFLAGNKRLGLYGGLVFVESVSRCTFGVLAVVGVATSQSFVAAGMAAAPILSLSVVPWALGRRLRAEAAVVLAEPADVRVAEAADMAALEEPPAEAEFTLAHGTGFAAAVLVIMVCEQMFLNAGPLIVKSAADSGGIALAGFAFNVVLIARAPLQLFQAIQTAILPHLTELSATADVPPGNERVARRPEAPHAPLVRPVCRLTVSPDIQPGAPPEACRVRVRRARRPIERPGHAEAPTGEILRPVGVPEPALRHSRVHQDRIRVIRTPVGHPHNQRRPLDRVGSRHRPCLRIDCRGRRHRS
jgi:hypothetical protein